MQKQTTETVLEISGSNEAGEVELLAPRPNRNSKPETLASTVPQTGWEIVVGTIVGLASPAGVLVTHSRAQSGAPMKAGTVVAISEKEVGRQAVLAFEDGDLAKPIILGLIRTAGNTVSKVTVGADGDKFVLVAEREIELRCGEASIILTRAGKVLIRGEYVLTSSAGVNRIKGGSVQIN
jgi:hypothetical protein